jgi:hypothetical protein
MRIRTVCLWISGTATTTLKHLSNSQQCYIVPTLSTQDLSNQAVIQNTKISCSTTTLETQIKTQSQITVILTMISKWLKLSWWNHRQSRCTTGISQQTQGSRTGQTCIRGMLPK